MKSTLKTGLFSAMTALGTVALLTSANAAGFGELDTNTDGQLDLAELQVSFGENAQSTLDAYDTDADSMISVEEAEAMAAQSAVATGEAGEAAAATEAAAPAEEATIAPGTEAEANAAKAESSAATAVTEGAEAGVAAAEGAAADATATIDDAIRNNTDDATATTIDDAIRNNTGDTIEPEAN